MSTQRRRFLGPVGRMVVTATLVVLASCTPETPPPDRAQVATGADRLASGAAPIAVDGPKVDCALLSMSQVETLPGLSATVQEGATDVDTSSGSGAASCEFRLQADGAEDVGLDIALDTAPMEAIVQRLGDAWASEGWRVVAKPLDQPAGSQSVCVVPADAEQPAVRCVAVLDIGARVVIESVQIAPDAEVPVASVPSAALLNAVGRAVGENAARIGR